MGDNNEAEVRIKLVADDQTSATTQKIQDAMSKIGAQLGASKNSFDGLNAAASAMGPYLEAGAVSVGVIAAGVGAAAAVMWELGEAAVHAADEAERQQRAMAGVLTLLDQGEHSMQGVYEYAGRTREELEMAGIKAGVSAEAMTNMFDTVVERGAMSSEKAKELTEQMAVVGRITKGGMEGLAQGFSMVEMGVVRARNPIVQLVAATHLLQGNARAVAQQMQHMTQEKQMALAEKAIAKQAEMMKGQAFTQTPSLSMLETSFEGFREKFLQAMGEPMLAKILPPLNQLKEWLVAHTDEIEGYADEIGEKFSEAIDLITTVADTVVDEVRNMWPQIKEGTEEISKPIQEAWQYIYDHKDAIAKTMVDMVEAVVKGIDYMVKGFEQTYEAAKQIASALAVVLDTVTLGASGNIAATAGYFGAQSDASSAESALVKAGIDPEETNEDYAKLQKAYHDAAIAAGENVDAVNEQINRLASLSDAERDRAAALDQAASAQDSSGVGKFVALYNDAAEHHDKGLQAYAAKLVAGNDVLAHELADSGAKLEGGFKEFAKLLGDSPLAKLFKEAHNPGDVTNIAKDAKPSVNFYGAHFTLHQDFKNEDPDRVALVFRKDIGRAAMARTQSRTAMPFGL